MHILLYTGKKDRIRTENMRMKKVCTNIVCVCRKSTAWVMEQDGEQCIMNSAQSPIYSEILFSLAQLSQHEVLCSVPFIPFTHILFVYLHEGTSRHCLPFVCLILHSSCSLFYIMSIFLLLLFLRLFTVGNTPRASSIPAGLHGCYVYLLCIFLKLPMDK